MVVDWPNRSWLAVRLARDCVHDPELRHVALRLAPTTPVARVSRLAGRPRDGADREFALVRRTNFARPLVRNRARRARPFHRREAGREHGGTTVTPVALFLIFLSLAAFVAGQL